MTAAPFTKSLFTKYSPKLAIPLLSQHTLVIGRQLEMLNIFIGLEQHNRYVIQDETGQPLGYLVEENSFARSIMRQFLRLHRPFKVDLLDLNGMPCFSMNRRFTLINSKVEITVPNTTGNNQNLHKSAIKKNAALDNEPTTQIIKKLIEQKMKEASESGSSSSPKLFGEVHQVWHPWRRQYDLFGGDKRQFGKIDEPFLSWDFKIYDENGIHLASINRNFTNLLREVFSDTGMYVIRFHDERLSLKDRAVILGAAVTIDFDYFSRHSSGGGFFFFPLPFFGGGGDD